MPKDSKTSALPVWLDIALLPCLAILIPIPADTNAAAVEMLNVPRPSPPVPQVSNKLSLFFNNSSKYYQANRRVKRLIF